jgi:UDP-N-acetylmuramyl pentapeptide phosphotransferase/UDP-N-acetylglucosamine-1-phosphate transferase
MAVWLSAGLAALASAALTAGWIRQARRRQVVDAPERRRLHDAPTPRGGGIGPVLVILAALAWAWSPSDGTGDAILPALLAGLLAVAAISFVDDHRSLSVRLRLGVHVLAAAALAGAFVASMPWPPLQQASVALLLVVAAVASMNLHNFMDGSDAHLASQGLFVFAVLAALAHRHGAMGLSPMLIMAATALAAFLPFNWPRARVFLGDVGSISLGFLVAAFSLLAIRNEAIGWGGALVLSSTFMIDASATLIGRMRRTRHWLKPHRDHLYQWLRRRGWSAARVVAVYQGWNVLVVVPAIAWLDGAGVSPVREFAVVIGVYGLGLGVWCAARGALRRAHRAQYRP